MINNEQDSYEISKRAQREGGREGGREGDREGRRDPRFSRGLQISALICAIRGNNISPQLCVAIVTREEGPRNGEKRDRER
jgi:hypothetical protein